MGERALRPGERALRQGLVAAVAVAVAVLVLSSSPGWLVVRHAELGLGGILLSLGPGGLLVSLGLFYLTLVLAVLTLIHVVRFLVTRLGRRAARGPAPWNSARLAAWIVAVGGATAGLMAVRLPARIAILLHRERLVGIADGDVSAVPVRVGLQTVCDVWREESGTYLAVRRREGSYESPARWYGWARLPDGPPAADEEREAQEVRHLVGDWYEFEREDGST